MALTESQIQELYIAYFGRPADVEGKNYWSGSSTGISTQAEFAAIMHANPEFQDSFGSLSIPGQIEQIYQNLFSRSADAGGLAYWTAKISDGTHQLAEIAVHLISAATGDDLTAITNKTSSATAFTTDIEASATAQLAYSGDDADAFTTAKTFITGITTTAATAAEIDTQVASITSTYTTNLATGVTYSLTTSADDLTGGAKNDTFAGVIDADTAASNTFTALDSLNGGAGTDTLSITYETDTAANAALPAATITNIETFKIRNSEANEATIDFGVITGETSLNNYLSAGLLDANNLASGTAIQITGNASITNGASEFDYVAAATASTLTIDSGTVGTGAVTISGTGLLTQTINSTGAANAIGALGIAATTTALNIAATTDLTTGAITSAEVATLTITGAGDVDLNAGDLDASTITVTASAATGDIDIAAGAVAEATDPSTVDIADITITTGSGNDDVDVDQVVTTRELSVSTGAGDDKVTIGTALTNSSTTSAGDVINAGTGTDTLSMTSAIAASHATTTDVSGFEIIEISNALVDTLEVADFGTGVQTVNLATGTSGTDTGAITFNAGASVLNLAGHSAGPVTLTDTGTATTDSITINITDADDIDIHGGEAYTITGFETATFNTTNSTTTATTTTAQTIGAVSMTADTGGTTTLNVTGNRAFTAGVITANTIDASGMTAAFSNTGAAMVGTASGVNYLTGGSGNDVLVGDAGDTTHITGGAGDDNITGGSDFETLAGGAGADTISGGGGNDTITGGAGNDTITVGSATATVDAGAGDDRVNAANFLAYGYSIDGGAGTDILDVTAAEVIGDASVVTNFETLHIDGAITIDLTTYANNTFTTVETDSGGAHAVDIDGVTSELIQFNIAPGAANAIDGSAWTGSADSMSLKLSSTAGFDTSETTIAALENLTLTTDDTDDATFSTFTVQLTATSLNTITINGDTGVALTGSGNLTTLNTIDASAVTLGGVSTASTVAGLVWASTNSTVGDTTTYTGTNGADNLTGHANTDDTFSGGLGVDTLVYTGRADTFTGGGGNDVFDINADGTSTQFLTITDLAVGDTLDFAGVTDGAAAIADAALGTKITLGANATLTNYLDNACSDTTDTTSDSVIDTTLAKWFQFGGDTYIAIDNSVAATYTSGTDGKIKISGEIDLSTSTFASEILTIVTV